MRILYHHRTRSTDAQRIHILEMARAFEALGHTVTLVSLVDTETAQKDAGRDAANPRWQLLARRIPFAYDLIQLGYNVLGLPWLLWKLFVGRQDAVYERYSLYNFSGVLAARIFSLPLVLEVNSPFALEQSRDRDIQWVALARWSERTICNLATIVIVVSTPLRRIMIEAGVDASKLVRMSNGVDVEKFAPQADTGRLRESLNIGSRIVIGFVGWFRKWHGLEMLVEAFHQSRLSGQAVLLLIGDGAAMSDLRASVANLGLEESVLFTGPLPHDEIPVHLQLIDIAVQPAANEYCCPMKILEYMAMSKAIVAPSQENISELLVADEEASYFQQNDPSSLAAVLSELVHSEPTRTRMGTRAYEAIARRGYLWTENAAAVVRLIEIARQKNGAAEQVNKSVL